MKKNHVVGAIVMAVAVLLAIPLGTNRSFARLREKVSDEYYYDDTGYAIWQGVDARVDIARNACALADKYAAKSSDVSAAAADLTFYTDLCDHYYMDDVQDVGQLVENNRLMGETLERLCDRLEETELAEKDKKYPQQLRADMRSEQDKLERSSFNNEAIKYNAELEKFPASFLAPLTGVKSVDTFGPGTGGRTEK